MDRKIYCCFQFFNEVELLKLKLEELYNSIDEQPLDLLKGIMNIREKINVEELEDRVSKIENALLELAHYPCLNNFNRDDVYLALRKAGMVRGNKDDKN